MPNSNIELEEINKIDQAIYEAEQELKKGIKPIPIKIAKKKLDKKYFGNKEQSK